MAENESGTFIERDRSNLSDDERYRGSLESGSNGDGTGLPRLNVPVTGLTCCGFLAPDTDLSQQVDVNHFEFRALVLYGLATGPTAALQIFWVVAVLHFAYLDANQTNPLHGEAFSHVSSCQEPSLYSNQTLCELFSACECEWKASDGGFCDGSWDSEGASTCKIELYMGMEPSKLVPIMFAAANVVLIIVLPLTGVIADSTDHRLTMLRITAMATTVSLLLTSVVGEDGLWWVGLISAGFVQMLYDVQWVLYAAYLPEISPSESVRSAASAKRQVLSYFSQLGMIVVVSAVGFLAAIPRDRRPFLLNLIACLLCGTYFAVVTKMVVSGFGERKASRHIENPTYRRVAYTAFTNLVGSWRKFKEEYRMAGRYLIAHCFHSGAANSVYALIVVYGTTRIGLDTTELAVVSLILLVSAMSFARLIPLIAKCIGLQALLSTILVGWVLILFCISMFVYKQDHKVYLYPIGCLMGALFAGQYTVDLALFSSLVTVGDEAEFIGLYAMAPYLVRWIPSVVYSVTSDRIGIGHILIYYLLSLIVIQTIDFREARSKVKDFRQRRVAI